MAISDPPVWLNTEFLTASLENRHEGKVDVIEYEAKPAVTEGNNFCSCLYRVKLKFKKEGNDEIENTSLIVKAPIPDGIMKEFADEMKFVEKELQVYNELLPEINRLLENETLTPKKFFSIRDDALVLEDLNESGYRMVDRIKQLDLDHCLNFIRTLAKFHACTVAIHENNPELIETIGKELVYTEENKMKHSNKWVNNCLTCLAKSVETIEGYEYFGEKIRRQIDTIWDKLVNIISNGKCVKVLNHGDTWTNNILFKHDNAGNVVDVKLIDLQMCRYGSPAIDIQYFIMSSVNEDVRNNCINDLINEYRDIFNATLCQLNCNIRLSAEELEEAIKLADAFGFLIASSLLPIVLADPETPPRLADDKEVLQSTDVEVNTFLEIYYGQHYKEAIAKLLDYLEKRGFFS